MTYHELQVTSHFSFLRGASGAEELFSAAALLGLSFALAPAFTADARAEWRLREGLSAYLAAENLLDADVETSETADGVEGYAAPRVVRIGLRLSR